MHSRSFWVTPICSHFTIFVSGNCLEGNSPESNIFRVIGFHKGDKREGGLPEHGAGARCRQERWQLDQGGNQDWEEPGLSPRWQKASWEALDAQKHWRFYGNDLPRAGGGLALKKEPLGECGDLGLSLARPLTSLGLGFFISKMRRLN